MQTKKSLGLPREARAKWGQNFLRDGKILKKIADFARVEKGDTVVEVGPGEGTLTKFLLERANRVVAIEKDKFLTEKLREKFRKEILDCKLEIVNEDILNYELRIMNYALVGNIPYYITGALFKKFLDAENQPKSITFIVQKEVADRIMARDGKESILSISIKAYGKPEFGGVIKAGSFFPRPKVDSAIIHIGNIGKKRFGLIPPTPFTLKGDTGRNRKNLEKKFFEILRTGFAHKRKLLIRNLEKVSKGTFGIPKLKVIFAKCDIPEKARAEDLELEDWITLTKELQNFF